MRLTRSRDDVVISGLLAGIGEYFNIDPTIIRIAVVLLFFATPFPVVPLYVLGAILVPKASNEDKRSYNRDRRGRRNPRSRMNRDFREFDDVNRKSSSRNNDIDEEDWSDF